MIHAILTFQFGLTKKESGELEPEFKPIRLVFKEDKYTPENFSNLINESDLFSTFYHHTTSVQEIQGEYSNIYIGRLKNTPYKIISYFKQLDSGSQFLTLTLFSLDDEVTLFEGLIMSMAERIDIIFETYEKAVNLKQFSLIDNIKRKLENELKYTIFQIERLSHLDKLQIVALIYSSEERLKILNTLRENPISKRALKEILEEIKENPNIDLLIEPFLELNLIRRDWIKGERDKRTGLFQNQGEYLFLTKDVGLIRVPNIDLLNYLKESNNELFSIYQKEVNTFFSRYDPTTESIHELGKLTSLLLNPDIYDAFSLLRNKFYPVEEIPQIFSQFADNEMILTELKEKNVITEIIDKNERHWIFLLTDIKPVIFFPEYLLPKIREAYKNKEMDKKITIEIAKKALELLEVTYSEKFE